MASKARSGGLAIAVALALLAPLVAGVTVVVVRSGESPLESAAAVEPLVGAVERAERYQEATVAVTITFAPSLAPATQASGTLTKFGLVPGVEVVTGTVIGAVNNADIVGYVSDAPLFRDIFRGLKGEDVATAQHFLKDVGYYTGDVDGIAGRAVEESIKAFNAHNGWGSNNGVLTLASVVWAGQAPVTVAEVSVAVGEQVSPGTALFTTTAGLTAIAVTESASLPADGDATLTVNGVTVPYQVGTGAVSAPDDVAAIAAAMGTTPEGVGTVARATPQIVGTVPSSAVILDESGQTCIFPDITGASVSVTPLGGTLGTVDLDESLVGHPVLINPRDVREDLTCD